MTARWFGQLSTYPKAALFLGAATLVALIALLDYLAGSALSLSLFYLAPVSLTAWLLGRGPSALMILLAASLATLADVTATSEPLHPATPYWNLLMHIGISWAFVYLLLRLKRDLAQEAALSRTDALTGLANPRAFYETAERELERMRRYGGVTTVVYLDLDNFKLVNDRFGHRVGDELLRSVAQIMGTTLRKTDTAARLGGDEFALLLPHTDAQQGRAAIAKLRERLLAAMRKRQWPVTFSIGVLSFATPPETVAQLLSRVDALMYRVKRSSKDAVSYQDDG